MKIGVSFRLNVTKIDKARLFKGAKGTYLDFTGFIDLDNLDQYGNSGFIAQDITKEEKDSGVQGNILGNSKVFWKEGGQAPQANQQAPQQQAPQQQQSPQQIQTSGQPNPYDFNNTFDDSTPF